MANYEDLIGYSESDAVKNYRDKLNTTLSAKPADYQSQYTTQLDNLYNQLSNRQPFSYDVNSDALYQQYKNQYVGLGKQAMKDTMGQAAALTGGYGSTYSQRAGQQAYNSYLQQLNDKVPELAQLARNNYDADTTRLQNLYSLTKDRDDTDYNRWADQVAQWQSDVSLYNSLFSNERDFDFGVYSKYLSMISGGSGGSGGSGSYSSSDDDDTDSTAEAIKLLSQMKPTDAYRAIANSGLSSADQATLRKGVKDTAVQKALTTTKNPTTTTKQKMTGQQM